MCLVTNKISNYCVTLLHGGIITMNLSQVLPNSVYFIKRFIYHTIIRLHMYIKQ